MPDAVVEAPLGLDSAAVLLVAGRGGRVPVRFGKVIWLTPWAVCDVSVIMQLKFQQSSEFVFVPQIQFIVRVLDISVLHRARYAQCQTLQQTVVFSRCVSWTR